MNRESAGEGRRSPSRPSQPGSSFEMSLYNTKTTTTIKKTIPNLNTASLTCMLISRRISISMSSKQDKPAIKNWNGEKIENRQIQADHCHQSEERRCSLPGGVAGKPGDADRPLERFRGHTTLDQTLKELIDQRSALNVLLHRLAERFRKRELRNHDGAFELNSDHPA